jgi:hypothetical protein
MNQEKPAPDENQPGLEPGETRSGKKRYQKPAVRFERVFETSALSCGKVQTTQSACHANRKTS